MARQDNYAKFLSLRKDYPCLSYESFHYSIGPDSLVFGFEFRLADEIVFHPVSEIPWKEKIFSLPKQLSEQQHSIISALIFHIGMVEMISYWKAACPPLVRIPLANLKSSQLDFWKKLYFNGLGEFFYMNSIPADLESFMTIECGETGIFKAIDIDLQGYPIIPVGGGKDSAVTLGLLENAGTRWIPFAINPIRATKDVIAASGKGKEDIVSVNRKLDQQLLDLNKKGYLNGHTPFSAIVAFYGLLASYLTGSADIVLSNESSANESTIPGTRINHQYSKTYEFEKDFRQYVRDHISPSFNYFSLLRPLTEMQIARLFAAHPEYFKVFRSCNAGSKAGEWCGKCPKCLFTWIILSPFISQETLRDIFGKDLLQDSGLSGTLDELSGASENKPFECIGTLDEVNLSLHWLLRNYPKNMPPALLNHYTTAIPSGDYSDGAFVRALETIDSLHFIPGKYLKLINLPNNAG